MTSTSVSSRTKPTKNKQDQKEQRILTRRSASVSSKEDPIRYFRRLSGFGFGGNGRV